MRSDLAAKLKSAREQATNDARGGDEEVLSLIARVLLIIDNESYISRGGETTEGPHGEGSESHPSRDFKSSR
jgi:hypothetical protein